MPLYARPSYTYHWSYPDCFWSCYQGKEPKSTERSGAVVRRQRRIDRVVGRGRVLRRAFVATAERNTVAIRNVMGRTSELAQYKSKGPSVM